MLQTKKSGVRALAAFGLAAVIGLVAGCGGGGSGSTNSASASTSTGSGSTTSGSTSGPTSSSSSITASGPVTSTPANLASNQVAVRVSSVMNSANVPMVSVKICQPGSTTACATIDNVQVDTGSYGLRLSASAVNAASATLLGALPTETVSGQSVAECAGFADGYSWGSVRTADVMIGGETAPNVNVHILGDLSQTAAGGTSNSCASGTLNNTPSQLGANGILGIGTAKYDCGSSCLSINRMYFGCTTSGGATSCTNLALTAVAQEVSNPVRSFARDNNGVALNMPTIGNTGATSASGFLTFGVGTTTNNAVPSSVQTFTTDHYGDVKSASIGGQTFTDISSTQRAAFFDSGSNGLFFPSGNTGLTYCQGISALFYCPSSALALQPSVTGFNGATATIGISVQNALNLFNGGGFAFNNLGGDDLMSAIDFGMPFFYGRTVYLNYDPATDGTLNTGTTAYVAF